MSASPHEVLFEFQRHGNVVKVSAVHVASNTEICIVGAASAGEQALKTAAINRLVYVMGAGAQVQPAAQPASRTRGLSC